MALSLHLANLICLTLSLTHTHSLSPSLSLSLLSCTSNIANGGLSNFQSSIITSFGFSQKQTSLLGMGPGLAEIVAVAMGVYVAFLTKTRVVPGVLCFLIAIIGAAMIISPISNATKMLGLCFIYAFPTASPLFYSWLSSSIGGTSKKIVFNVVLQLGYCKYLSPSASDTLLSLHLSISLSLID